MRQAGLDRSGPRRAVRKRPVAELIDEFGDEAQRDGAGEIPKGLRRQFREAGNDGEGDRAEAHGEMRALAD